MPSRLSTQETKDGLVPGIANKFALPPPLLSRCRAKSGPGESHVVPRPCAFPLPLQPRTLPPAPRCGSLHNATTLPFAPSPHPRSYPPPSPGTFLFCNLLSNDLLNDSLANLINFFKWILTEFTMDISILTRVICKWHVLIGRYKAPITEAIQ